MTSNRRKSPMEELLDAPVLFGLRAQGKLERVRQMRADGCSWDAVGKAIGWSPEAVKRFYEIEADE